MGLGKFSDIDLLKILFDTMADGVMLVDCKGKIISLNPSAEKITGYRTSAIKGKPCTILDTDTCAVHPVKGENIHCDLFKKGKVVNKKCQVRRKDGKYIHLLKNAVVLKDKKGKILGAVETMTDVTSLFIKDLEIEELRQELSHEYGFMGLIGKSPHMQKVYEQIRDAARSDVPINILGESGTGKELVAQAIHGLSRRREEPFIRVNCAAMNEYLLESELFGHRKGSFTGAISDRKGRFEAANKGSLFLDEIGDMPIAMQAKILRVLQENEIDRIGDNNPTSVDVRIITATNKNINQIVENGSFREDLFYRINVFPISIPPLRERAEDIPALVSHYLKKISILNQKKINGLTQRALDILERYNWPGNVRQLINVLEYGAITCKEDTIDSNHLPGYLTEKPLSKEKETGKTDNEKQAVIDALEKNNYSRMRTADYLGISRVALWKKMKRFGISQ